MSSIEIPAVLGVDHGRTGQGTQSILPHLQLEDGQRMVPDLGISAWAETCPGSLTRLWSQIGLATS